MFTVTREIGIDMGHRVTNHASKCRNVHGHRYTIYVTLTGALESAGSSEGMVLDFGFLKELMMKEIDAPCDHGLCLWVKDALVPQFCPGKQYVDIVNTVATRGYCTTEGPVGKLYIMDTVPTAENLAEHWYRRLRDPVDLITNGRATIERVRVSETPNCFADYIPA